MATVIQPFVAVDGNGNVRASARLYFYLTGTVTPQNTYADAALSSVNVNPVVADSNGLFAAIYLGDPPTFSAYKAILKTSADVTVWTTDPIAGAPITTPISAALLRGYLGGLAMSSRTTTTITYAAGVCADSTNTSMLSLAAGTIDGATVGADGLDAGALAVSTWYHAYAIGKTDGTTARLASTSASSPTMPSGYTLKRRIGSFKTNGSSQIVDFTQDGDQFQWLVPTAGDYNVANPGTSAVTMTLNVPTGVNVRADFQGIVANAGVAGNAYVVFSDLATTDTAPAAAAPSYLDAGQVASVAAAVGIWAARYQVRTNTSGQIRGRLAFSDGNVRLMGSTIGWFDKRGRDA